MCLSPGIRSDQGLVTIVPEALRQVQVGKMLRRLRTVSTSVQHPSHPGVPTMTPESGGGTISRESGRRNWF